MKNVHYEKTTLKILGWYDGDIHTSIPKPNIEVEDNVWYTAISNNHNKVNVNDKTTELFDFRSDSEKIQDLKNDFIQSIQKMLDEKAQQKGYDNINSIAKYLGYENRFRSECESLGVWCAECWDTAHSILLSVENGERNMPTVQEVIEEMPILL